MLNLNEKDLKSYSTVMKISSLEKNVFESYVTHKHLFLENSSISPPKKTRNINRGNSIIIKI
jgi:hypothetical protein